MSDSNLILLKTLNLYINFNDKIKMSILLILFVAFCHLLITLPSFIYHECLNIFNRLTSEPLQNEKIIILVPGRGEHYTNFLPLIKNIAVSKGLKLNYKIRMVNIGDTKQTSSLARRQAKLGAR